MRIFFPENKVNSARFLNFWSDLATLCFPEKAQDEILMSFFCWGGAEFFYGIAASYLIILQSLGFCYSILAY